MTTAQHNYLLMRTALDQFEQPASELEPEALAKANEMAAKALELQHMVLQAPEAAMAQVPENILDDAMTQMRDRFETPLAFQTALESNNLDEAGLRLALKEELLCDAVLESVASSVPLLTEEQAEVYYQAHTDKFEQPERRYARHILITENPDFPENRPEQVKERMAAIHQEISVETFGFLANRHSECPSAMNDGELGWVEAGLLFPELDKRLFAMAEGEISEPIATEVGSHILYCQEVKPAHTVPFSEACQTIIQTHHQQLKARAQKAWLQQLSLPKSA